MWTDGFTDEIVARAVVAPPSIAPELNLYPGPLYPRAGFVDFCLPLGRGREIVRARITRPKAHITHGTCTRGCGAGAVSMRFQAPGDNP